MNKGLRMVSQFLGNVSEQLNTKLKNWGGILFAKNKVLNGVTLKNTIRQSRVQRVTGMSASIMFGLLALAIIIPLYNVTGAEDTEAATGTAVDSSITFTSTRNTASVAFNPTSTSGTFASSTAGTSDAAFSLSTTNSQGYTLKLKSSNGTALKTSTSATDTATLSAITSSGIESGSFTTNTWGYLPNYYNCDDTNGTCTTNTTKYYPATTSDVTLRTTTAANSTAHSYTIGIGAKADLTRDPGTYTLGGNSSSMVLSYAVNPTAYEIKFDKGNAAGTVSGLPSTQSGTVSATSETLSSTTPTQSGYTFKGWCLGTVSTSSGVDTCSGTTFAAGAAFGIDRTANNEGVTLHAMWDGNVYAATFYYNNKTSSGSSGTTSVTNTGNTYTCRVTNTSNTCTVAIPDVVKNSVGTYNNGYVGVATATGTMSSSTTVTLSANASRYAVYRSTVTLYKPSSTSARTSVTLYRNQWFTSATALATTVLSSSTTGTSNYDYSSSVSGYALYGFSASTNTATRTYTNVAGMASTNTTTFYAIDYDSDGASATFYYNNNTTTNSCTTAAVKSTTGTAARYLYTTSSAATTTSGESISVPTAVSNSKGTCGMTYKNVGTSTSNMTAASPTAGNTYYASYSGSITNYYYSSSYTNRTIYRNQWVNGTGTSSMSSIVLSTSATGTSNYSTATGPGSSVWAGLATSATTTVAYGSVSDAATASATYSNLYTIYQFDITYSTSGSTGVSGIGSTSGSCRVTTSSTSCSVTLPTISVTSGYESLGWGTQGHTSAGIAAGSSYTLSSNNTTLYANAKQKSKLYMQNMTSSDCTTTAKTVYDSRDENAYLVQKLSDNKCWMLDNLRLGSTSTISLTSSNTNLPSGVTWTLPASGSWTNSYGTAYINSSDKDKTSTSYGSGSGKIGVYYNYCAASAGNICVSSNSNNGSADRDICPKGWRMPTGGSSGEYQALYTAYSSNASNFRTALSTPLSGYFNGGSATNQGSNGYFWSSTRYGNYYMYNLLVNSSLVSPSNYNNRDYGGSVRCVMTPPPTIADATYMQDVTAEMAENTEIGVSKTLIDSRDNNQYLVAKLADGKIWMLDNLRLGSTSTISLTSSNTNLPSGVTWTLPASGSWTNSYGTAYINSSDKDKTSTSYGSGSGKIGVYYNYCAASAGNICVSSNSNNGSADRDICPKGWRMPTGGSSGEYQALYTAYSSNASNFRTALSTPLSGYFDNGSAYSQGSYGNFWSSTRFNNYIMYDLGVDSSSVYPTSNNDRYYGSSVRCVLK